MPGIFVCGRCFAPGDERFSLGTTSHHGVCTRCGGLAAWVIDQRVNEPFLAVHGYSPEFVTSCEIERFPTVIWDVNGYYRELGVDPRATKVDLRKQYQKIEGWNSERLTYIVKQLLNDEVRHRYDATSFGSIFIDDYILASVRREREDEARAALLAGDAELEDLESIDLNDSLGKTVDMLNAGIDKDSWRHVDSAWGYYRWQSACADMTKASEWRGALVAAFWERGESRRIAVGFHGGRSTPWEVVTVGDCTVVFLNEVYEPNSFDAAQAAEHIINGNTPFLPKEMQHGLPQGSRSC